MLMDLFFCEICLVNEKLVEPKSAMPVFCASHPKSSKCILSSTQQWQTLTILKILSHQHIHLRVNLLLDLCNHQSMRHMIMFQLFLFCLSDELQEYACKISDL